MAELPPEGLTVAVSGSTELPPLTHLETRVLDAIEQHIQQQKVSPTIAELAATLRLKSKGTVHRYVQSLIEKQRLEKHGNGWRGLRVIGMPMPDAIERLGTVGKPGGIKQGDVVDLRALPTEADAENGFTTGDFRIPLLGKIAAGLPIEAIEDQNYLDLAEFFIGPDRYALRVTGDSMVDAGILDGDTVILRKQHTANTGDIVVALVDGQEATLKRLGAYKDGMVELVPENATMPPMFYSAERVSFQGVLVGQLRSY